jgi:gluconokinase
MVVILMGVAGSGKSTVGLRLAGELGWAFCEGDDLHPPENVAKMARGEPLTDDDRWPWLARLRARIVETLATGQNLVVTCSALKAAYRRVLKDGDEPVRFVYLQIPPALVAERVAHRQGHFMKAAMVDSQFAALEAPTPSEALVIDAAAPIDDSIARIRAALGV